MPLWCNQISQGGRLDIIIIRSDTYPNGTSMIIEQDRILQKTNSDAYLICLEKQWCTYNDLKKKDKIKMLCGASIIVLIAPGSPVYQGKGLKALKAELMTW